MKVLVINAGSSSLKYQLINMDDEHVLAKGICERIGTGGEITHSTYEGKKFTYEKEIPTHTEAFKELVHLLTQGEGKVIESMQEIAAVGQRVVQGAEYFSHSVKITGDVLRKIEDLSDLAPLHNPAAVLAIKACQAVFGDKVPQIAVFDTAFHQTMPKTAYLYGIPYEYYQKYHIRRYGFHGTSHRYLSARFFELSGMQAEGSKIVTCHLGSGSSICAIKDGKSVDTSMGFTPLDGLMMGTRSGTIDPSIVTFLQEKEGFTPKQINEILNKQSGSRSISGISNDNRDITDAAHAGNERAKLALNMFAYQIKKFVGGYAAAMGGLDALIFAGGIGENDEGVRRRVCKDLEFLGINLDLDVNIRTRATEQKLSKGNSKVQVWLIPTDEEMLIARDTKEILEQEA